MIDAVEGMGVACWEVASGRSPAQRGTSVHTEGRLWSSSQSWTGPLVWPSVWRAPPGPALPKAPLYSLVLAQGAAYVFRPDAGG